MDTSASPGKNLRDLRQRREVVSAEIKALRAELTTMKAAGQGGPQRQAIRARLVELRRERQGLVAHAKTLKAAS